MSDPTLLPKESLLPCPWCGGSKLNTYRSHDGDAGVVEYVQCMDCTSCGPDHKNGRHWNTQPALTDLRASLRREENARKNAVSEFERVKAEVIQLQLDRQHVAELISGLDGDVFDDIARALSIPDEKQS